VLHQSRCTDCRNTVCRRRREKKSRDLIANQFVSSNTLPATEAKSAVSSTVITPVENTANSDMSTPVTSLQETSPKITIPQETSPQETSSSVVSPPKVEEKSITTSSTTDKPSNIAEEPAADGPSLKSFASLMQEVEAEDEKTGHTETNLTQKALDNGILEYIKTIELPSVRVRFENAKFEIDEEKITVTVASTLAKGTLQSQSDFLPFLRQQLGTDNLLLLVNIDLTLQEQQKPQQEAPRILTNKDKYIALKEINLEVDELRKRLDLGFDNK